MTISVLDYNWGKVVIYNFLPEMESDETELFLKDKGHITKDCHWLTTNKLDLEIINPDK